MKGDINDVVLGWVYTLAPIGILLVMAVVVVVTVLVVRGH